MILLSVASLSAKYDLNSTKEIPLNKDIRTGTLSNGMKYFIQKNKLPEGHGHFRIVLNAGSINEDDDQNGLAHFTEHMCFNGTKNYPKNQLLDVLQKSGVRFGADVNASTSYDQTLYELPIPLKDEKLVKESFQILSDWAGAVTMNDDDVNEERGIIISEWRQRMNVFGRLQEAHSPVQFWNSKYAERNVIGDTGLLRNFKPDVIRRFYKDWYRPNLMAFVAVGDFDVDKIEQMTKEYFGVLQNPANERKREIYELPMHPDTKVSIAKDKEMPFEMASVITKLPKHDENTYAGYALTTKRQLFDIVLNNRLQEISNNPNPPFLSAGGGSGDFLGNRNAFYGQIRAKNGGIQKAIEGFVTEVTRIKQHGINQAELDRVITEYKAQIEDMKSKRNTTKHNTYVDELTNYFIDGKSAGGVDFDYDFSMQVLEGVKVEDINALSTNYLTAENTVITINLPEKADASKITNDDILATYKAALDQNLENKEEKTIDIPLFSKNITNPGKITKETKNDKLGIETFELSNGAKVVMKKTDFKDNEILISGHSWGGHSLYSDKDFASASLATSMVGESGLSQFSKTDLDKVLTGKIAGVNAGLSTYSEFFQGKSSTKDLETVFQLMHLYATDTRMDKESYANFVEKVKPGLLSKGSSQDDLFRDSVQYILGNHHFRSQPFTMSLLEQANYEKGMQIFKERFSNLGDFTYFVVGDFEPAVVKEYFAKYIGSIPAGTKETYKDLKTGYPDKASKTIIRKGNDDKGHIRLTFPGSFDSNPKSRYEISAMADALQIRLIETIREKLGATYSPGIWAQTEKTPRGQFACNIDMVVDPKKVDDVVKAVVDLIKEFKSKPDEEATDKVKKADLNELEVNMKNNNYWIAVLSANHRNGESFDNILKNESLIKALTAKDVQAAAKKYLNTDKMIQIISMPE